MEMEVRCVVEKRREREGDEVGGRGPDVNLYRTRERLKKYGEIGRDGFGLFLIFWGEKGAAEGG